MLFPDVGAMDGATGQIFDRETLWKTKRGTRVKRQSEQRTDAGHVCRERRIRVAFAEW